MGHRMIATLLVLLGVLQPALAPMAAQGQREGIKVHGHWVIDVRNPDGTLSSHTEFENALDHYGALGLSQILSREVDVTGWLVSLHPGSGAPFGGSPIASPAFIFEPVVASLLDTSSPAAFSSLTVAHPVGTTLFVLKGVATATGAGEIDGVHTVLFAAIGNNTSVFPFTNAELPTALRLAVGQIVQVTVTVSFS